MLLYWTGWHAHVTLILITCVSWNLLFVWICLSVYIVHTKLLVRMIWSKMFYWLVCMIWSKMFYWVIVNVSRKLLPVYVQSICSFLGAFIVLFLFFKWSAQLYPVCTKYSIVGVICMSSPQQINLCYHLKWQYNVMQLSEKSIMHDFFALTHSHMHAHTHKHTHTHTNTHTHTHTRSHIHTHAEV